MLVLVVEDEAIIAYCAAAMLEDAGYTVLGPAHTADEAIELIRNRRPDVALVDIDLEVPGAGIGLARQLRSQHGTAVIFTTGRMDLARTHADTAVGVLAKPYDPAELASVVEYADSVRRASASRATPPRATSFVGLVSNVSRA
ncbi:MAG TPA: response regulator [Steroidobacteraceae bacterium]|nr:response regulator [Steroidobacteraceae bacterium]